MDIDFMSIFFPLYFIGIIVFEREYNVSVRMAAKVCMKKLTYAAIGNGVYLCLLWATICVNPFRSFQFRMFYLFLYFLFLSNLAATCYINIYKSDSNVRVLSSLQEISNCLYRSSDIKKFKVFFLSYFCLMSSLWITNVTGKMVFDPYWSWIRVLFGSVSIIFDFDMAHTITVVYILTRKLQIWNNIVEDINFGEEDEEITIDRKTMMKNMYQVIKQICEAWKITTEISGFKILLHFITTFVMFLMYIMTILIFACTNTMTMGIIISHTFGVTMCLCKLIIVEWSMCFACEAFYREAARARCNVILKSTQDSTLATKRLWKGMKRLMHINIEKMNASGLFTIDAVTLIHFSSIITSHIIVLLQFYIL